MSESGDALRLRLAVLDGLGGVISRALGVGELCRAFLEVVAANTDFEQGGVLVCGQDGPEWAATMGIGDVGAFSVLKLCSFAGVSAFSVEGVGIFLAAPFATTGGVCGSLVAYGVDSESLSFLARTLAGLMELHEKLAEREELSRLEREHGQAARRAALADCCRGLEEIRLMAAQAAGQDFPVAIVGERGLGKIDLARFIHDSSERRAGPFVVVHCEGAGVDGPAREIFGPRGRSGRLAQARGGTLYVEDADLLPAELRKRLAKESQAGDARLICSVRREPGKGGVFPPGAWVMRVPPLRSMATDVPALINHCKERLNKLYGRRIRFSPEAMEALAGYSWPGNLRELEGMVERLFAVTGKDVIELSDIPSNFFTGPGGAGGGGLLAMERQEVLSALADNGWVQSRAAAKLGITPRQMRYKVRKYGLKELVDERRAGAGKN